MRHGEGTGDPVTDRDVARSIPNYPVRCARGHQHSVQVDLDGPVWVVRCLECCGIGETQEEAIRDWNQKQCPEVEL